MNIKHITANEFLTVNKTSDDIVIDLRTNAEVASECIDNCINLPVQELEHIVLETLLTEKKHQQGDIYLLCQTGRRADMALEKLKGQSKRNFVVIDGGLNALKANGAKIISGSKNIISLERQVRIAAGLLVLVGVLLGYFIHPGFFVISGFVGAGLMFSGITDTCGMAMVLAKMPWNKVSVQ